MKKPNGMMMVLLLCCGVAGFAVRAGELEKGFTAPPDSAKPHTWWHWMNGNVTKEGITADLEAMQRVGIGGVQIFNIGRTGSDAVKAVPAGPVEILTPEWRGMMKYAATEADRLGLELCIQNCPGWATSGGPWNTPENSMQKLVTSEVFVSGPRHFSEVLPQPPTMLGCYRDIEVLAFPTPVGENMTMQALSPKVTASAPDFKGRLLFDGDLDKMVTLPEPDKNADQFIQFEFKEPVTARSVRIDRGANALAGTVQVSADGLTFHDIGTFCFVNPLPLTSLSVSLEKNTVSARFYRIAFSKKSRAVQMAEISFSPCLRIDDVSSKSGINKGYLNKTPVLGASSVAPGLAVNHSEIINLLDRMRPDGRLDWDVPAGQWTILRIGHTPTGRENQPAPKGGLGLECDKMSAEALDIHWNSYVQKILDDFGPLAGRGKVLNSVLLDSYEAREQNWTPKFREEFLKRRGYDPLPWLVTVSGRVVNSPEASERFLWDMRRTIADLIADNCYGHFQKLCHQRGLTASIEPYAGPFESLLCGKAADIPMGEFWVNNYPMIPLSTKLASSVGHIYGKPVIGAEAFTADPGKVPTISRWQDDPYSLKALGDWAFCQGINRFIFHRYALQPWTNRWPGMTMDKYGAHLDRTVTWWEQGRAWMEYLARSQFMLQQGRFVADAAAFRGESSPAQFIQIYPALPPGYDYDSINADVLLNEAEVQNGELVLKSGMRYRMLSISQPDSSLQEDLFGQTLPPADSTRTPRPDDRQSPLQLLSQLHRTMTPQLLRKLRDFVADGLTLVGPPPLKSPSLNGYPQCDAEVQALVAELWGDCDGKTVTEHRLGKGKVVWGQTMAQVMTSLNLKPDFEYTSDSKAQLIFIHRRTAEEEIYFISNQRERFDAAECTFRVSGKVPEFWHPDTGVIEQAPVWREENGRITVPMEFDPAGSVFVVFRKKAAGDHVVSAAFSVKAAAAQLRQARYESADGKQGADVTGLLNGQIRDNLLKIKVSNKTLGGDPAPGRKKQLRAEYVLNGQVIKKAVPENAMLEIDLSAVPVGDPSGFALASGTNGQVKLSASAPGSVELKTAAGKVIKAAIADVSPPVEIAGPWKLDFPPNWGAPATVTLDKLISWTEHADRGVKYFSGTAVYTKNIDLPAELFGDGKSLRLDLGAVKNIAEVFVNGKPLGILWKPPFCVDISAAANPGKNKLEIKITNLWPNRLIGDEQLPPDCEWTAADALKAWPKWLLDGKPSPSGRLTFTTWHHWKKGDALLPSGLLGPVVVQPAVQMDVK